MKLKSVFYLFTKYILHFNSNKKKIKVLNKIAY